MISLATSGNRQPFVYPHENLPVDSQTYHCIMKKELTLGTPSVPVFRESAERFRELLNRVLPEECQVKNATDCWYAGAAVSGVCAIHGGHGDRLIVKKEVTTGINIESRPRYKIYLKYTGTNRDVYSISLDELKEVAAFLTAYVEKEEKEGGNK